VHKLLSISIAMTILSSLYGCAVRTVASGYQAQEAPQRPSLAVPAPDPLLFPKCLKEARAKDLTSPLSLTPSCQQLHDWQCSTEICNSDDK